MLCWGRISCTALGPPSFTLSFSPHVLGLPTLENVILTIGKEPETLGFLAVLLHLYYNLRTYSLQATWNSLCLQGGYDMFSLNTSTLLFCTGWLFSPEIRLMASCKATRSLVETTLSTCVQLSCWVSQASLELPSLPGTTSLCGLTFSMQTGCTFLCFSMLSKCDPVGSDYLVLVRQSLPWLSLQG